MAQRAAASGDTTWLAAARRLVHEESDAVREHEIRAQVFERLTSEDAIRRQSSQMSAAQWRQFMFEQIRRAPLDDVTTMAGDLVQAVDENLDAILEEQAHAIAADLQSWMGGEQVSGQSVVAGAAQLVALKSAYAQRDTERFNTLLSEYLSAVAEAPPEGISQWRQSWESFFNRLAPFYLATICYLVGFILTILSWILYPVWLNRLATAVMLGGWVLHVIGIVMSIGISGRAPVTGLYSSFVFVTSVVVGLFMLVERMTRMGFGNLLAGMLGVGGLMWAWNIALGNEDTFAVLVAVLDTNFWLSTHVICVSLGYSATLAAGALGATFILGGLLTPWLTVARRQELIRLIYGTACFALLFSFVGTVLGGLWADDSWGRFWGWDPKENGALMIVLWNAVVLHARWGGMVRQRGLAGLAVIGNAVTAWSWEGVNQLGVGLHAYALSDAAKFRMLVAFWAAQFIIAALAMIPGRFWLSRVDEKSSAKLAADA
jgi:ABC-type transport system involved in cytochrome c biogenesis permease subunit